MPSLAAFHPQIVHFVVALIVVGVGLRWASLARPASWLGPAAVTLVALGTLASLLAVRSGGDAHGPVERLPGVRPAVVAHETWGERARNVFLLLLGAEAIAAALAIRRHPRARASAVAAGVVGLAAVGVLYRAAELGGVLVYGYGGGVGIRSGAPGDVPQVFVSAAAQQSLADRAAGRPLDAARLADLVAARFPDHVEVQLFQVEATIVDRGDPQTALNRLGALTIPPTEDRLRLRAGLLRAQALEAMADPSAARQVLETLRTEFPASAEVQRRLGRLARP